MVQWPWQRRPVCRICGAGMTRETVTYSAPDGEGRPRRWEGVVKYTCPNGCTTGFLDFRRAVVVGERSSDVRLRRQQVAWTVTGILVAVGLVAMYALFMYAIAAMPLARMVRIGLWVATTIGFATVGALLVLPARRERIAPASTSSTTPAPQQPQPASQGATEGSSAAARAAEGSEAATSPASRRSAGASVAVTSASSASRQTSA